MSEPRRGLARDAPHQFRMPRGIERGDEILDRQGTIHAIGLRGPQGLGEPERNPNFGGGSSPVKTGHTVRRRDRGKLAVWEADGYLAIATESYLTEPPADGLVYGRNGLDGAWVPVSSNAGLPEAPNDGRTYTRTGLPAEWTALPYLLPESPTDGQGYVRVGLNRTWQAAFTECMASALYAPITTVSFPEAPNDGQSYARRGWDGAWVPVATGMGVPEAPIDGRNYSRRGSTESWVPALPDSPLDGQAYARRGWDNSWVAVATGLGVPEAPPDGRSYTRRGSDETWQPAIENEGGAVTGVDPPLNPFDGQFWWDAISGQLYLWYNDGTSSQWVPAAPSFPSIGFDGGIF